MSFKIFSSFFLINNQIINVKTVHWNQKYISLFFWHHFDFTWKFKTVIKINISD